MPREANSEVICFKSPVDIQPFHGSSVMEKLTDEGVMFLQFVHVVIKQFLGYVQLLHISKPFLYSAAINDHRLDDEGK